MMKKLPALVFALGFLILGVFSSQAAVYTGCPLLADMWVSGGNNFAGLDMNGDFGSPGLTVGNSGGDTGSNDGYGVHPDYKSYEGVIEVGAVDYIPEPATIFMLGLGLAGLVRYRRKI